MVCMQIYREKLRAEVEGRPYTPPPPSSVKQVSRSASSGNMSRSRSAGRVAGGNDDWDEWGDAGKVWTLLYDAHDVRPSETTQPSFLALAAVCLQIHYGH